MSDRTGLLLSSAVALLQLWFPRARFITRVSDHRTGQPLLLAAAAVGDALSLGEWVWQVVPERLGKQRRAVLPGLGWNQTGQKKVTEKPVLGGGVGTNEVRVQRNTSGQRLGTGGRSGVAGVWHGLWAGEVEWGGQTATGGGQRHGGFCYRGPYSLGQGDDSAFSRAAFDRCGPDGRWGCAGPCRSRPGDVGAGPALKRQEWEKGE